MTQPQTNTCENCGRPLFGRTDKRFCTDSCRNNFNRNKAANEKQQAHENLPEIFRIIKRNYELLLALGPIEIEEALWLQDRDLTKEGLNPKFFTSTHIENGTVWKYCFERGWQDTDNTANWFIQDRPEQAEV